jgi:hypothetical protein
MMLVAITKGVKILKTPLHGKVASFSARKRSSLKDQSVDPVSGVAKNSFVEFDVLRNDQIGAVARSC